MDYYLGINYGHNASAAVVNSDGELVYAVEEGRLINLKNTSRFPINSIQLIEEKYSITHVAEGWDIWKRLLMKGIFHTLQYGYKHPFYFHYRFKKEITRFWRGFPKYAFKKIQFTGHHLAHAYSLLPSGLKDNSLVFVSDTMGEKESISCFYWYQNQMKLISVSNYPNSIGSLYHQFAYHLGFSGSSAPGKLMALSSFGKPKWIEELRSLVSIHQGKFQILKDKFPSYKIRNTWRDFAESYCKNEDLKKAILTCYQDHEKGKDLAASMQQLFTEVTIELIHQNITKVEKKNQTKIQNVGISGGTSLNCQANYFLLESLKNRGIHSLTVSPWSEDSGTSIGAAVWLAKKVNKELPIKKVYPYLGPEDHQELELNDKYISDAVEKLVNGKIIGLFDGRLEFGPRALGGRCILARADSQAIKDKLNRLKGRHSFMPFAPVCLEEEAERFFHPSATETMTIAVPAKACSKKHIIGAWHENELCRVQVVKNHLKNKLIYQILEKYKQRIGVGILLLTSLNFKDKAIPANKQRALEISKELGLDGLVTRQEWYNFEENDK